MKKPVGTIDLLSPDEIKDNTSYTHNISIKLFVEHLNSRTNAKIFLPSKDVEYFKVSEGEKVAVIGTVNLYVTELTE